MEATRQYDGHLSGASTDGPPESERASDRPKISSLFCVAYTKRQKSRSKLIPDFGTTFHRRLRESLQYALGHMIGDGKR